MTPQSRDPLGIRLGEIVKVGDGTLRQVLSDEGSFYTLSGGLPAMPGILQIAYVTDLFEKAGHPVPLGAKLVYDKWGPDYYWFAVSGAETWIFRFEWRSLHGVPISPRLPDLSRTPALDAKEALPPEVRGVVE